MLRDYLIYAIPLHDDVPIQVQLMRIDGFEVGSVSHPAEIDSYERY